VDPEFESRNRDCEFDVIPREEFLQTVLEHSLCFSAIEGSQPGGHVTVGVCIDRHNAVYVPLVVRITKLSLRKSNRVGIIHDFFSLNSLATEKTSVLFWCKKSSEAM